jgi:hypothetical protein
MLRVTDRVAPAATAVVPGPDIFPNVQADDGPVSVSVPGPVTDPPERDSD